jgi:outer membrane receptor for ferrienterochelin and colicin
VQTLNPFPDNNDPNNRIIGNPYIQPEMIHAVEAGAQWSSTTSSINITIYMRQTLNKIQRIRTTEGLVSTIQFVNLNAAMNNGAEGVWRKEWARWINTTLSANAYAIYLNSKNISSTVNDRGWAWTSKLLLIMKPINGIDLQLNSNYNSPFITPQGKIKAIYYTDISIKKDVLKKRGSLVLGLSDLFDTRQFAIDTFFENITQDVIRKRESRILTLGFNYKFGNAENTQRRKSNVGEEFGGGGGE